MRGRRIKVSEAKITKVYTRTYTDSGQRTTYVEWSDGTRTEWPADQVGAHATALLQRAERDGIPHTVETW